MRYDTRGFTLIELMITVAIVGILAAIAYPSYLSQVRKSRRADAQSLLLQAANRQERRYTNQHTYAGSMGALSLPNETDNDAYAVNASLRGGDDQTFVITARAQGDQTNDTCATYTLNELGEKKASNGGGSDVSDTCW